MTASGVRRQGGRDPGAEITAGLSASRQIGMDNDMVNHAARLSPQPSVNQGWRSDKDSGRRQARIPTSQD